MYTRGRETDVAKFHPGWSLGGHVGTTSWRHMHGKVE